MKTLKTIKATELQVGNIVHFYGARFEVLSIQMHIDYKYKWPTNEIESGTFFLSSDAKWLDGDVVNGYFGPTKNWNFQGNHLRTIDIEV